MKSIVVVITLLYVANAYAATVWEHLSSGDGTAFEKRWVLTTAITSMSSNEKLASDMPIAAALWKDTGLFVFVNHTSSEICSFSDWKLAVDKSVIPIKSELSEGTKQTGLIPADDAEAEKLLKLFREGEKIAVRFRANCDNMFYLNFIGPVTLTYSLEGSSVALKFLKGASPQVTDTDNGEQQNGEGAKENNRETEAEMLPIVRVAPVYPARALSLGLEGHVDMSFTITTSGTVEDPVVIRSTDPVFDRAARRAVLKYKYRPRIVEGLPVSVSGVETRVLFRIEE